MPRQVDLFKTVKIFILFLKLFVSSGGEGGVQRDSAAGGQAGVQECAQAAGEAGGSPQIFGFIIYIYFQYIYYKKYFFTFIFFSSSLR